MHLVAGNNNISWNVLILLLFSAMREKYATIEMCGTFYDMFQLSYLAELQ